MQWVNLGARGMKFGYVEGVNENQKQNVWISIFVVFVFNETYTCIAGVYGLRYVLHLHEVSLGCRDKNWE